MTVTREEIEVRRAARKAAQAEAREAQYALDLEEVDRLEIEHGDSNIAVVEVPFSDGLPVLAAVKAPSKVLMKRYHDRLREKNPDAIRAAEELGRSCAVYPEGDVLTELLDARPALLIQLGTAAAKLAQGKAEAEGKE